MPSGMTSAKRFAVRTALVTGSTLATIIGAESLAMLDNRQLETQIAAAPTAETQLLVSSVNTGTGPAINAAPSIIIIRHAPLNTDTQAAASAPSTGRTSAPVVIQPPMPVAVQAPAAIVVQSSAQGNFSAPPQPTTRSSR